MLGTEGDADTGIHPKLKPPRPLECSAEVYDFEKQLRYRVFAPSGSALISISGIPLSKLSERDALDAEIDKTRARLEQQGFVLEARPS